MIQPSAPGRSSPVARAPALAPPVLWPTWGLALWTALRLWMPAAHHGPLDTVFLAALALLIWRLERAAKPSPSPGALVAVVWLAAAVLTTLTSWTPAESAASWGAWLVPPFALWATARASQVTHANAQGRLLMRGVLAALGAGSGLTAMVQKFWLWPRALAAGELTGPAARVYAAGRPFGFATSPDLGAALALAGLAAALSLALETKRSSRTRSISAALAVLALGGTLVATSMGTIFALSAGCTAALLAIGLARLSPARRVQLALGGGTVLTVALIVFVQTRGLSAVAASAGERILNWQAALRLFSEHMWTGVGPGRFVSAYETVRIPGSNETRFAHSALPHALAEMGVWGGLALALLVTPLWRSTRDVFTRAARTPADAALFGGLIALSARTLIDYDLSMAQTGAAFGVLLGITAGSAAPRLSRVWATRLALGATLLFVPLAGWHTLRHDLIDTLDAGVPAEARLLRYRQLVRADERVNVAAMMRTSARLRACRPPCTALRAQLEGEVDRLLTAPHPPALAYVIAAHLARDVGRARAQAMLDAGLAERPGSWPLLRTWLNLRDEAGQLTEADVAHAARWQPERVAQWRAARTTPQKAAP